MLTGTLKHAQVVTSVTTGGTLVVIVTAPVDEHKPVPLAVT